MVSFLRIVLAFVNIAPPVAEPFWLRLLVLFYTLRIGAVQAKAGLVSAKLS